MLDHEGKPCFAELAILRTLLAHGWSGAWVEAFRGRQRYRFLQSMPASWQFDSDFVMPEDKFSIFASIGGACLDVMAWRGADLLFCEAKRHRRDKFKAPQLRFIEGALARGIPREAMLVVEWSVGRLDPQATAEAMSSAAQ